MNKMVKEIKLMGLDRRSKAIDFAEFQMQHVANNLPQSRRAIAEGIINVIGKLLAINLKDEGILGENELTCIFFDCILTCLTADPLKNISPCRSDTMALVTPRQRPDAVISKMNRLSLHLRLALMRSRFNAHPKLLHEQIYTMTEIGHFAIPPSIEDLSLFINLSTLTTLLHVNDAFWRACVRLHILSTIASRTIPHVLPRTNFISIFKFSTTAYSIRLENKIYHS
ncbi:hypothetical protein BX666DRAFT_662816 [Dichotomocladium elegans]|nr:hypothetical protein BX666DRAFT_662816 [Dichotomocladium elegans]